MTRLPRPGEINRNTDLRVAVLADAPWYDEVLADLESIKPKPKAEVAPAFHVRYPEQDGHHAPTSVAEVVWGFVAVCVILALLIWGCTKVLDRNTNKVSFGDKSSLRVDDQRHQLCKIANQNRQVIRTKLEANANRYTGAQRRKVIAAAREIRPLDCRRVVSQP